MDTCIRVLLIMVLVMVGWCFGFVVRGLIDLPQIHAAQDAVRDVTRAGTELKRQVDALEAVDAELKSADAELKTTNAELLRQATGIIKADRVLEAADARLKVQCDALALELSGKR